MKDFFICALLATYGALLTKNQFDTAQMYYDIDLTVSEIAANQGVSRQSINDTLIKVKSALENYENKLNFLKKKELIAKKLKNSAFYEEIVNILEE